MRGPLMDVKMDGQTEQLDISSLKMPAPNKSLLIINE